MNSNDLFYMCLTLGPQYDPILLNHAQTLAEFFEVKVNLCATIYTPFNEVWNLKSYGIPFLRRLFYQGRVDGYS